MVKRTPQQTAAIERGGRVIVSASAGSGKTYVMIERLSEYIQGGGDLDGILAVTFTKKAAAQMKEKLRAALIKRSAVADEAVRAHIKTQLGKIALANISTIHSFCAYLLRVYFYALGIDGSFEIMAESDGEEKYRTRALDSLFERLYETEDEDFYYLLERYGKKRGDRTLRGLIISAYESVRNLPDYKEVFTRTADCVNEQAFNQICEGIHAGFKRNYTAYIAEIRAFIAEHKGLSEGCRARAVGMIAALKEAGKLDDIFAPRVNIMGANKKRTEGLEEPDCLFFALRDEISARYRKLYEGYKGKDRQTELKNYLSTARLSRAFSSLLLEFDAEYAALKREEGKLDYGDLEHLTLRLLSDENLLKEVRSRFVRVFVDEYQDVNPVQERIIELVGGDEVFLVGDVKQAIYGFRGSKSEYFTRKTEEFAKDGNSLILSHNFRSAPAVIDAVNACFSKLMRKDTCGIDYKSTSVMVTGGAYPSAGGAYLHMFGKDEKAARPERRGVYSVENSSLAEVPPSREGLAVLDVVRRELNSTFYDVEAGAVRRVEPGDICILTRKNENASPQGIMRALTSAGLSVTGGQSVNVCETPEVKQLIDVLSYIDNGEQDIPLASALLSPVGGMSEDELAKIKITYQKERKLTFRECCARYVEAFSDSVAQKLDKFFSKIGSYRSLSALFGAGTVIDAILRDTALEARYYQDGGKKLKNVRRLAETAYTPTGELSVPAFLSSLKSGGFDLELASGSGGDSITMMTMHSSKGLEFPVVIIADVVPSYRGRADGSLPFDARYGFAHKFFDMESRISGETLLAKLLSSERAAEEVKNEMNVLYVACTRAKYRLHVMSSEARTFNPYIVSSATSYAQMLDFSCFKTENSEGEAFTEEEAQPALISKPDEEAKQAIGRRFMQKYAFEDSINLPVKSSASAILRMQKQDAGEDAFSENVLWPQEEEEWRGTGETGVERGTAYHRFLQLCDFDIRDEGGIAAEIEGFVRDGLMPAAMARLVSAQSLAKILKMPCFERARGARIYREQEFLCALPANSFMDSPACDEVLVQGAMDLLCRRGESCAIIDYKYSSKPDALIVKTYKRQLDLYRLAAGRILKIDPEKIEAYIVNIFTLREIKLN